MEKDFEHYWEDFKQKVPIDSVLLNGKYNFAEENLRMLCMGFYFCGKENALEEATEQLKKLAPNRPS